MTRPLSPTFESNGVCCQQTEPCVVTERERRAVTPGTSQPLTINSLRFPFNSLLLFSVSLTYHQNITRGRQALTKKGF